MNPVSCIEHIRQHTFLSLHTHPAPTMAVAPDVAAKMKAADDLATTVATKVNNMLIPTLAALAAELASVKITLGELQAKGTTAGRRKPVTAEAGATNGVTTAAANGEDNSVGQVANTMAYFRYCAVRDLNGARDSMRPFLANPEDPTTLNVPPPKNWANPAVHADPGNWGSAAHKLWGSVRDANNKAGGAHWTALFTEFKKQNTAASNPQLQAEHAGDIITAA